MEAISASLPEGARPGQLPASPSENDNEAGQARAGAVCGVCEANPPKYKCPRCYLPYCSVTCNRVHRDNHPPDPEPISPTATAANPELAKPEITKATKSNDALNPFSALDSSDQLRQLFRKYPSLVQQLHDIYAATQPPSDAPDRRIPASLMQGIVQKGGWNHDIGIKNGKDALRKARQAEGIDGDAIREYTELVLHLINTQVGEARTTAIIQQNIAQEDSKLIEQLMAQEKR